MSAGMSNAKCALSRAPAALASAAFALICSVAPLMANEFDQLAGSEWRPIEINGKPVPDAAGLFVRFETGGKVAANGGCNRMGGTYQIDAATLKIGPLFSTRKACAPDIMAREAAFGEALETTRLFLRDRTKLTLKSAQGVTTLRLAQTDWD